MSIYTEIEQNAIYACKSNHAVHSAMLMNPTNFPSLINDKVPEHFWYNDKIKKGGIYHGIIMKTVPGTPQNLFCNTGIATAFGCATGDMNKCGGYPKDSSSQVINDNSYYRLFNSRRIFYPGEHYEEGKNKYKGYLTNKGIKAFEDISKYVGAVYCVTKPPGMFGFGKPSGHTGMIMATELEYLGPPINKHRGWLYTIEYNTRNGFPNNLFNSIYDKNSFIIQTLKEEAVNYYDAEQKSKNPSYLPNEKAGDERTGGKLAFRARLIGGLWFRDPVKKEGDDILGLSIGSTENFDGGIWAPRGLSSNNKYFDFPTYSSPIISSLVVGAGTYAYNMLFPKDKRNVSDAMIKAFKNTKTKENGLGWKDFKWIFEP
jgi:hypothetical protein